VPVSVLPPVASGSQQVEKWQSLDSQYGLDDMFDEPEDVVPQTVDEEYMSYISAPLSGKGTDLLSYWQVRPICLL
jgi:hypothetical protein